MGGLLEPARRISVCLIAPGVLSFTTVSHDITDFQTEVLERSRTVPVVVDFWAEWCGPCRVLGPTLERLAEEAGGRWELAKVDTEALPEIAQRYAIMSIPNVKLFVNGEVVDEFVGALPETRVRAWLDAAIPSPQAADLATAAELLDQGKWNEALAKVTEVLGADPGNRRARLLRAEAQLHTDPGAVAETLQGMEFDPEFSERAGALANLAGIALACERPGELPESPVKPRFIEAGTALRAGDWNRAMESLIAVLQEQRDYADGAAREGGRALFQLLGIRHPVCERHHRAFSSAINV